MVHTESVFAQFWQAATKWCVHVQKVVFADLSTEAVSVLNAELARQYPRYIMSLKGTEGACSRAAQWLFQVVKVTSCATAAPRLSNFGSCMSLQCHVVTSSAVPRWCELTLHLTIVGLSVV